MMKFIDSFKDEVDRKYQTIICKLSSELTHPQREIETSLGNLVADAFADNAECDVMFVGSGSIRVKQIGPVVTLKDLLACFPYDDSLTKFQIKGSMMKKIFNDIMRIGKRISFTFYRGPFSKRRE